jgi:A/G-specific adenine glycosylase
LRDSLAPNQISSALLNWYDRHARDLPWRVSPGARARGVQPDPYHIWLSEIMLQQTTVAAVKSYFLRFVALWPRVQDLAAAPDAQVMGEWAGLGYYARARNLLKCARAVTQERDGVFPQAYADLIKLPGIGPYTAAAISSIAFDRPEPVLDGNVERVMARLHDVHDPLPAAKPALMAHAAGLTPDVRPGDYAQAVMDLGATICTPKSPACALCPIIGACAAKKAGTQAELPRKLSKKPKPIRYGSLYIGRRTDGAWLLERRPEKGLLGGMLGWPGSQWSEIPPTDEPPCASDWKRLTGEVRHTFTHFHLILNVYFQNLGAEADAGAGFFVPPAEFRPSDLPTVMRKAFDLAQQGGTPAPRRAKPDGA